MTLAGSSALEMALPTLMAVMPAWAIWRTFLKLAPPSQPISMLGWISWIRAAFSQSRRSAVPPCLPRIPEKISA